MSTAAASLCRPYPIQFRQTPGIGIVYKSISPDTRGRVYFDATHWPARLYDTNEQETCEPGATVYIIGRQGLTLLVTPKPQ